MKRYILALLTLFCTVLSICAEQIYSSYSRDSAYAFRDSILNLYTNNPIYSVQQYRDISVVINRVNKECYWYTLFIEKRNKYILFKIKRP